MHYPSAAGGMQSPVDIRQDETTHQASADPDERPLEFIYDVTVTSHGPRSAMRREGAMRGRGGGEAVIFGSGGGGGGMVAGEETCVLSNTGTTACVHLVNSPRRKFSGQLSER